MIDHQTEESLQKILLRRIVDRDKQALAELYDQLAAIVFSVACRILGDRHEAEEVTQDVFVQIWNKAPTFDGELGTPFHWAMRITRNRAIDRLRSRQRRTELAVDFQEAVAGDGNGEESAGHAGLSGDELTAVRAAVRRLPPDQVRMLELAFFRGLSHAEIAESTGEPLGTIKARIRRAMLKLRDTLQDYA